MSALATHISRTLIADDQPDVLVALRLLLKSAGYQTEAANSPKAVLDAIKRGHFDVVLIDLNYARDTTSGQEGFDLISRIQAEDNSLPIVVMTAWATVDLAVEAMRAWKPAGASWARLPTRHTDRVKSGWVPAIGFCSSPTESPKCATHLAKSLARRACVSCSNGNITAPLQSCRKQSWSK